MLANELRIGNWVIGNEPFQLRPDGIPIAYYHEKKNNEPRFKPIPITEEWLIKFGFYKSGDNCYRKGKLKYTTNQIEKGKTGYGSYFMFGMEVININYIHQLQNLYHSLTGEEL